MNSPITNVEAKSLLEKIARKSKAKAVLAVRPSYAVQFLISSMASCIAAYVMADFAAPIAVKILIGVAFLGGILSLFDGWQQQRRLEAAIELLRQSEIGQDERRSS